MSAFLSTCTQVFSYRSFVRCCSFQPTCLPLFVRGTTNSSTWSSLAQSFFPSNKASSLSFRLKAVKGRCPSFWLQLVSFFPPFITPHSCAHACQDLFSVFFRLHPNLPPSLCVCVSLYLCETSSACLPYLVYLLQESMAASPSRHICSVRDRHHCQEVRIHVHGWVIPSWRWCVRVPVRPFVPFLSSSIRPVVQVDSTCVHLLVYLLHREPDSMWRHRHSILDSKQDEKSRQTLVASLTEMFFVFNHWGPTENWDPVQV